MQSDSVAWRLDSKLDGPWVDMQPYFKQFTRLPSLRISLGWNNVYGIPCPQFDLSRHLIIVWCRWVTSTEVTRSGWGVNTPQKRGAPQRACDTWIITDSVAPQLQPIRLAAGAQSDWVQWEAELRTWISCISEVPDYNHTCVIFQK